MIKTIKFLSEKIVIIEIMLIILYLAGIYFSVDIPYVTSFISTALIYVTPVAIIALIIYILTSILDKQFIKLLISLLLIFLAYLYFTKKL